MKNLRLVSRSLIGIVFIFSGFVKGIDPYGSTYKFIDYFEAFNLSFFDPIALPLALFLSTSELLIGICLFIGIRMKETSWALLIFMVFFTILTLVIAITNPVTDCGCFGDALILSNWQTFFKNIFFMGLTLIVFFGRKSYPQLLKSPLEWSITGLVIVLILSISIYCINHLPFLDFRPYNIGTYIPEKMEIPENAPMDEYTIKLFYQKDGIEQEFPLENLPDSTWEFVRNESTLIKQGYVPPIHDFTIDDPETGEDIADIILNNSNYTFAAIYYDLDKSCFKNQNKLNELATFCQLNEYEFIGLTSSLSDQIENYKIEYNIPFKFYNTDEITLKTIIRANPGLILLKEGVVINKWHSNDIPEINIFENNILANSIDSLNNKKESRIILLYISIFFLAITLFNTIKPYIQKLKK
ncbi:BT_3928 family protein [Bacteroidota bacterium]